MAMLDAPVWTPEKPKTPGEKYNNPQLDALLSRGYSLHSDEDAADGILILLHERSRILWRFNLRTGRCVSLGLAETDITVWGLPKSVGNVEISLSILNGVLRFYARYCPCLRVVIVTLKV